MHLASQCCHVMLKVTTLPTRPHEADRRSGIHTNNYTTLPTRPRDGQGYIHVDFWQHCLLEPKAAIITKNTSQMMSCKDLLILLF